MSEFIWIIRYSPGVTELFKVWEKPTCHHIGTGYRTYYRGTDKEVGKWDREKMRAKEDAILGTSAEDCFSLIPHGGFWSINYISELSRPEGWDEKAQTHLTLCTYRQSHSNWPSKDGSPNKNHWCRHLEVKAGWNWCVCAEWYKMIWGGVLGYSKEIESTGCICI